MNRRLMYGLGAVLLLAFAGFSMASFKSSLTQYVSYEDARQSARAVQVAGALVAGTSAYSSAEEALRFTLTEPDSGDILEVRYKGLKPANFEEAVSVVAIGHYDRTENEFAAEKLLVKCPSKYQGAEVEKVYGAES